MTAGSLVIGWAVVAVWRTFGAADREIHMTRVENSYYRRLPSLGWIEQHA